jgi:CDP-diglyceride synthetase
MKEKEQSTVVGQLLDLRSVCNPCIGYYFITTIDEFVKQREWWYDLLVLLIVICEVVYNWIQLMKVKDKIKKLPLTLSIITLSAFLSGTYFSEIWNKIQKGSGYRNTMILAIFWVCLLIIWNIVLWKRYKKNN